MPPTNERHSETDRGCALCESRRQPDTVEIFQLRDELDIYVFRIDQAKEITADGRQALSIAHDMLRRLLGMNEFDIDHLAHVDPSQPGVITRRFGAPVLLDGVHRALRCFAEKRPFSAFELTYEESLQCLVQQQVSTKDAPAIARKLRRAREFFPSSSPVDTPVECSSEVLQQVEKLLSAAERQQFLLRAVPEPE